MSWHGKITITGESVEGVCLLPGCDWSFKLSNQRLKLDVAETREMLTLHRHLNHEDFKGPAQVELVFANGITT